jgi:hypothetical protein
MVPATQPATARYPATLITVAGNAIGAAKSDALIAARARPIFRTFLKNVGVGDATLSANFIFTGFIDKKNWLPYANSR